MRLRTYESYWILKNGLLHTYPSVSQNLKTDIVVIGAGITGALVSHALRKRGYKIIVLDKKDVGSGSTSATTSMLQYEVDVSLHDLGEMIGIEGAALAYRAGAQAIDDLKKLVTSEKIDCSFELKESLHRAHSQEASQDLLVEFNLRKEHGLPVTWLTPAEIKKKYGLKSFGGILSKKGASVDAYRLAHGLLFKNSKRKHNPLIVYDQTRIKDIKESSQSVRINLENGRHIICTQVVYCNGFEATTILKEKVAKLFDTYACVSEEDSTLAQLLHKTLVWDTNDPYLYMRTTDDARLLVGGEDSTFRMEMIRQKIKDHKSTLLIKALKDISPGHEFIEDFTWAGTFGSTKDGLPYIGKSPEFKRAFFVLGFGGNGITFSAQAMKLLPEIMEGKVSPLAHHYRFGR